MAACSVYIKCVISAEESLKTCLMADLTLPVKELIRKLCYGRCDLTNVKALRSDRPTLVAAPPKVWEQREVISDLTLNVIICLTSFLFAHSFHPLLCLHTLLVPVWTDGIHSHWNVRITPSHPTENKKKLLCFSQLPVAKTQHCCCRNTQSNLPSEIYFINVIAHIMRYSAVAPVITGNWHCVCVVVMASWWCVHVEEGETGRKWHRDKQLSVLAIFTKDEPVPINTSSEEGMTLFPFNRRRCFICFLRHLTFFFSLRLIAV